MASFTDQRRKRRKLAIIMSMGRGGGSALSGHVTMGDSWTFTGSYWRDAFEAARPGITFHTVSNNGWGVVDLIGAVGTAAGYLPASVSILAGINDLATITAAQELTDFQTLVSALKAAIPGVKVFVSTVVPSTTANINTRRATLNPNIRAGAGVWHDGCIPLGDYLEDAIASDNLYYDNGSPPGHPRAALGTIIREITGAVLDPYFAGATASSPSAFTFSDIAGAITSTSYTQFSSAPVTGMAAGASATGVLTGAGTWKLGRAGTSDTSNKTVINGDWPAITATSSATYPPATAVDSTLTIGTRADTFTTTTGPIASDDFNRADGAPGSTPVGSLPWIGTAVISTNKVLLGQTHQGYLATNLGVSGFDITQKITIPSSGLGDPYFMFGAAKIATDPDWRNAFGRLYYIELKSGLVRLRLPGAGDFTVATFTGLATGASYVVRVVMHALLTGDRLLQVYVDGVNKVNGTWPNDANYEPLGYYCGVYDNWQNTGIEVDDFVALPA